MAAETCPCFLSIEQIVLLQVPLENNAGSSQGNPHPPALNFRVAVHTPVKEKIPVGVESMAQEFNNLIVAYSAPPVIMAPVL